MTTYAGCTRDHLCRCPNCRGEGGDFYDEDQDRAIEEQWEQQDEEWEDTPLSGKRLGQQMWRGLTAKEQGEAAECLLGLLEMLPIASTAYNHLQQAYNALMRGA